MNVQGFGPASSVAVRILRLRAEASSCHAVLSQATQMSANNTSGTILIRENTLLPAGLAVESEVFLPGWRVVKNLDRSTLARNIEGANWTLFCLAHEIRATVFGIDEEKMVRRAVKEILARLKSEKFNSLEITRVTSVASERFLEVRYVTVSAQSGLIQQGVGLVPAKDSILRMPDAPNRECGSDFKFLGIGGR